MVSVRRSVDLGDRLVGIAALAVVVDETHKQLARLALAFPRPRLRSLPRPTHTSRAASSSSPKRLAPWPCRPPDGEHRRIPARKARGRSGRQSARARCSAPHRRPTRAMTSRLGCVPSRATWTQQRRGVSPGVVLSRWSL
jgi:hypothetical protein